MCVCGYSLVVMSVLSFSHVGEWITWIYKYTLHIVLGSLRLCVGSDNKMATIVEGTHAEIYNCLCVLPVEPG